MSTYESNRCSLSGSLSAAWDSTQNARLPPRETGEHTKKDDLPAGGAQVGPSPEKPAELQPALGRGV